MENEDEIVEYALTFGIKKSGKVFHVSDKIVKDCLKSFIDDNSNRKLCQCEESPDPMMCFSCNLPDAEKQGISISLRERLFKCGYYSS